MFQNCFVNMNFLKDGGSMKRLPLLDETNYSYWKARMRAFIKSMDEKAWKFFLLVEIIL